MQAVLQKMDYNHKMQQAIDSMKGRNPNVRFGKKEPNSADLIATFSFDFAQQVQYPSNLDQPGSIFFKEPRKCSLFGINNENINRQTREL